MSEYSPWLLESQSHSTYPTVREPRIVKRGNRKVRLTIEHPKVPGDVPHNPAVALYVPGWIESELIESRHSTAIRGLTAVSMSHPSDGALSSLYRFIKTSPELVLGRKFLSKSTWNARDIAMAELADEIAHDIGRSSLAGRRLLNDALDAGKKRREDVASVIDELADEDYVIDMYPHSLGGAVGAMATLMRPESVRTLGLMASAGQIRSDTLPRVLPRVIKTAAHEGIEALHSPIDVARFALRSLIITAPDLPEAARTGLYAATGQVTDAINHLVLEHSTVAVNVQGENDAMFPVDAVADSTADTLFAARVLIPNAGHNFTVHQSGAVGIIANNIAADLHPAAKTSSRLLMATKNARLSRRAA